MNNEIIKYDAFISYKHSELDSFVAEKIHRLLETYVAPSSILKKTNRRKINRVFRDKDELPTSSNLSENIMQALTNSDYLIVICSPRTPESYWVNKEIETFIAIHGRDRVLTLLIEGEPSEAFPELLQFETIDTVDVINHTKTSIKKQIEPLAADVRGATKKEIHKNIKSELLRIMAPLLHCSYDDLRQRHRERRVRKILTFSLLCSAFFLIFGGFSLYQTYKIKQNYRNKLINQSRYLADTSGTLLDSGNRIDAIMVALEALPNEKQPNRPYVPKACYALNNALYSYHTSSNLVADRSLKHNFFVKDASYSPSGKTLMSTDGGSKLYLWDVETGHLINTIETKDSNDYRSTIASYILNDNLVVVCNEGAVNCYDINNSETLWTYNDDYIKCFSISNDYSIAAVYNSYEITILDMTTGNVVNSYEFNDTIRDLYGFSPDNNLLCFSYYESSLIDLVDIFDATLSIMALDINNNNTYLLPVSTKNISDAGFIDNNRFVVATSEIDLYDDLYSDTINDIILFDIYNESIIWTTNYTLLSSFSGKPLKFEFISIEEDSKTHDYITYTTDNIITTIASETAEIISQFSYPSTINDFIITAESGFALLAQDNGLISFVDVINGSRYYDYDIFLDYSIDEITLDNGVLSVIPYKSNNIVLYKYLGGTGYSPISSFDFYITTAKYSPDGSYIAVEANDLEPEYSILFYKNDEKTLLGNIMFTDRISQYDFTADNNLIVCTSDRIYLVNPMNQTIIKEYLIDDYYSSEYCLNNDNSTLCLTSSDEFSILNTYDLSVNKTGKLNDLIKYKIISNDGEYLITSNYDNELKVYSITKDIELAADFNFKVSDNIYDTSYVLSHNSSLLAVCCSDNTTRLIDLDSMKIIDEIEIPIMVQHNLIFSPDNKNLILQGDDGIVSVYNIDKGEYIKITSTSLDKITDWKFYEKLGLLAGKSIYSTYIFTITNDEYEIIADIPNCLDIDQNNNEVLVKYSKEMGYFPYFSLDMLIEEGNKATQNESLSPSDKLRYYID